MDYRALARAALIAGLVAGLAASLFGLAVTERYLDRTITLEETREAADANGTEMHQEVFSRRTQKAGLVLGDTLYGIAIACLFAGVYGLLAARRTEPARRRLLRQLAAGAIVAIVIVPFLKYPANPPGIGDAETLAHRQALYLACLALAVAGACATVNVHGALSGRRGRWTALAGSGGVALLWLAGILLLLPGRSDEATVPGRLLWQFRLSSVAAQLILWGVFAVLFARLLEPRATPRSARLREPA